MLHQWLWPKSVGRLFSNVGVLISFYLLASLFSGVGLLGRWGDVVVGNEIEGNWEV